ncbi:hypothetical protein [Tolypothrix sp. PCC 7601]|uniref:hypothetical protein n=1 Tax=Tolypothrix sp. PCC 7601 TaxID=1188 RepID=UPI0021DFF4E8|nr:hypothetical protein [Tolypothrix sp. PCC 7601]UYD38974.1 hypothetical protein HG267_41540 [Tolypothrix sp. PCC 7601]
MQSISEGYSQLAAIFHALEAARFISDSDFGANIASPYQWYISPGARQFLEKRNIPEWQFIQDNEQFSVKFQDWDGLKDKGAIIELKLIAVNASKA